MSAFWIQAVVAVGLFAGLLCVVELGYRAGRRATVRRRDDPNSPSAGQLGAIQGAILGLVGLLLGFSYAGAASRFIERQALVVEEANAISTAYLRTGLLDEPHRSDLRTLLRDYTQVRAATFEHLQVRAILERMNDAARMHAPIWSAAQAGVEARPAVTMAVLVPVNQVIDLQTVRLAAFRRHLPPLVIGLLGVCASFALAAIGYGCGIAGRRNLPFTGALAIVVAAAVWTTLDLDYPRLGFIRLDDTALRAIDFDSMP